MIPEWLKDGSKEVQRMASDIFRTNPKDPAVRAREKEIKKVMGVEPNILDPQKTPTPVSVIAPKVSDQWGFNDYANPVTNVIGIYGYKPGQLPYLEAHEAGHLSFEDAGPAKLLGVSGRTVAGVSDQLGNPAPLEIVGGLLHRFDAAEEDRAERLSVKYGPQLGGNPNNAPVIYEDGTSNYGRMLRKTGNQMIEDALAPVVDPIKGAISSINNEMTRRKQVKLQPQITELVKQYRGISQATDDVTPELLDVSKRLDTLSDQYGDGYLDFVGTIK